MINIGGDPNDAHYRYKRERIEIVQIQRCGGSMQISNIKEIARALNPRGQEEAFIKYFYSRLKKTCGIRMNNGLFKGDVSVERLETALEEVIVEKFLCPRCNCPELGKNSSGKFCKACGWNQADGRTPGVRITSIRKESVTISRPEVEVKTPAMSRACKLVRQFYAIIAKLARDSQRRREIERAIDLFWRIETSLSPQNSLIAENEAAHDRWCARFSTLADGAETIGAEHAGAAADLLEGAME